MHLLISVSERASATATVATIASATATGEDRGGEEEGDGEWLYGSGTLLYYEA